MTLLSNSDIIMLNLEGLFIPYIYLFILNCYITYVRNTKGNSKVYFLFFSTFLLYYGNFEHFFCTSLLDALSLSSFASIVRLW